jgi:hypothetical protein
VTNTLPGGSLRARLLGVLDARVSPALDAADAAVAGNRLRAARGRLQRALAALRLFRKVLASRVGRQGADATVRSVLDTAAVQVSTPIAEVRALYA